MIRPSGVVADDEAVLAGVELHTPIDAVDVDCRCAPNARLVASVK